MVEEPEGVRLSSVVYPTIWPVRCELVAVCKRRRHLRRWLSAEEAHVAPGERCQCGIYAANHPTRLVPEGTRSRGSRQRPSARAGAGRVLLWGTVVECEHGWRASHAYPERIYVHNSADWPLLDGEQLAGSLTSYGAPVQLVACETLNQLAHALAQEAEAA